MPHDRNGALLEVGDVIKVRAMNEKPYGAIEVGRIIEMSESQSCSGRFAFIAKYAGVKLDYFNASEALLVMKNGGNAGTCMSPQVYITGQYKSGENTVTVWELQGVFDNKEDAVKACRFFDYFVMGPVPLNTNLPDATEYYVPVEHPSTKLR